VRDRHDAYTRDSRARVGQSLVDSVLAASQSANDVEPAHHAETVLSVAVATLVRMEAGLLERRAGVNTDIVDDATILEHLACEEPGPLSLMLLGSMDPATLDFDGRLNYARAWDRQQRWATARAQDALVHVLIDDLPETRSVASPVVLWQRSDVIRTTGVPMTRVATRRPAIAIVFADDITFSRQPAAGSSYVTGTAR
jgi:hypothetical protein